MLTASLGLASSAHAGYDVTLVDSSFTAVSDGDTTGEFYPGIFAARQWKSPTLEPPRQWDVYPVTGVDPDLLTNNDGPEDDNESCRSSSSNLGSDAAARCETVTSIDVTGTGSTEQVTAWSEQGASRDLAITADLLGGNDSVNLGEMLEGPHDFAGGGGTDFLGLPEGYNWTVNLGSSSVSGGLPVTISSFENLRIDGFFGESDTVVVDGSDGPNEIDTDASQSTIDGKAGNDSIDAGAGTNSVYGDFGNDDISVGFHSEGGQTQYAEGGEGDDDISAYGEDITIAHGGPGNDDVFASASDFDGPDTSSNTATGGTGNDLVSVRSSTSTVGTADAGDGDDTVWGNDGNDMLHGGTGTGDEVDGYGGNDTIDVALTAGNTLLVGDGNEYSSSGWSPGADQITGSNGIDVINGGGLGDTIHANGGADTIFGDNSTTPIAQDPRGGDTIDAGTGADFIFSRDGDDTITGGTGDDYIDCGDGDDDVTDVEPGDTLVDCEVEDLDVTLETTGVNDTDDLFTVKLTVKNNTDGDMTGVTPTDLFGITVMPKTLYPAGAAGSVTLFRFDPAPIPSTLAAGESVEGTFEYLTLEEGKVLIRGEVNATDQNDNPVRDAHYAEVVIEPADDPTTDKLTAMGAMENFFSDAYNKMMATSKAWAAKRVEQMQSLPADVRKQWLGAKDGLKVTRLDEAMSRLLGISPEELATEVPRKSVIRKGGEEKITEAEAAVRKANGNAEKKQAEQDLKKVTKKETLTTSESMAIYNRARMETDNNELYKIYEDYPEALATTLWQAGGSTWSYLLQTGSMEGRQQILADLSLYADLNDQALSGDGFWIWSHPGQAYDLAIGQFNENVEQQTVRQEGREQLKRKLYLSDPEKAIYLSAQDDSFYSAQILRTMIDLFTPTPNLDMELKWGGKVATSSASKASIVAAEATAAGNAAAGRTVMNGAEDLGDGVRHADDFLFPSADSDELLKLDQLGREGGAGMKDQRIAEQLNREVTEQLAKEFPGAGTQFTMAYRPKKSYDPIGSLAKPQAFEEMILDPRSIQILGAPPEGLGKMVLFHPTHPSEFPGWKQLSPLQKEADLALYDRHLAEWTNFNKRNPTGKTADWKKALDEKTLIEFGGGHTVELKLQKKQLGPNAFEIQAEEMSVDGTVIHKGKPASIGSDLDPAVAIDANTGKKLTGEIEDRALTIWHEKALKAQQELGFRSGGHGAPLHGDDLSPEKWTKFARYAAVHLDPAQQALFEGLVVKRAGLPVGTKIFPAGLPTNEHLVRTSLSDTWHGPLGDVLD